MNVRKKRIKKKKENKKVKKKARKSKKRRKKSIERILENKEVKKLIVDLAGEEALPVVKLLLRQKTMDENKIAKKIKTMINVNQVRAIMYKLYTRRIVEPSRRRDRKKGWWIYSWTIIPEKIFEILIKDKMKKLKFFQERFANRELELFECENCGEIVNYQKALENMFSCPRCGAPLKQLRLSKLIPKIEEEIEKLKEEARSYGLEIYV